jgi:hypothetical protein
VPIRRKAMRIKTFLLITLLSSVAAVSQTTSSVPTVDPKTFYKNLPTAPVTATLFQEAVAVAGQLATLPIDQARDVVPLIFAAIKDDSDGSKHAALGLYAISKRSDSGDILKPYITNIAALFNHPDPAFKATAGMVLSQMQPPPEAADILLGFISGPTGTFGEKVDALAALTRLPNPPKDKIDAVAIPLLKQPMAPTNLGAAIFASMYPGSSDALVDAIAAHLTDTDFLVKMRVIVAFRGLGPKALGKYRGQLTKIANDPNENGAIKQFAQNTLDGKDEKCLRLQGNPPALIPEPGCK